MYAQVQKNITNYYQILKEQYSVKYVKEFVLGVGIIVCLLGGYFLHGLYVKRREAKAFGALTDVIESFEKAQYAALSNEKDTSKMAGTWEDTEVLLDALYKEHMGSYLAPYFLLYKAEIVREKGGTLDESRKILQDALIQIPKHTPLFELFELKKIKMSFDSSDKDVKDSALKDLVDFVQDDKKVVFEDALYTLGLYYFYQGDMAKAQESFKRLVKYEDKDALIKSPWIKRAQDKLDSLV